jgi:hypothetical protein
MSVIDVELAVEKIGVGGGLGTEKAEMYAISLKMLQPLIFITLYLNL